MTSNITATKYACPYCGTITASLARHICASPSAAQPNYTVTYTPPYTKEDEIVSLLKEIKELLRLIKHKI